MSGISLAKWKWIVGLLVLANIANYLYNNWGLVTVKVKDEPLSKVIRSIEWQGGVKIYTNLPLDSKVTMYVDHVPLAEAMESLAANVDVPPPAPGEDDGTRPPRNRPDGFGGPPPGGAPVPGGQAVPLAGGAGAAGGPPGGPAAGRGGFGRRAEWNLAFFVAPTAAQVRQEISDFQTGDPNTDGKVFSYGTQLQTIASDTVTSVPDPHLQAWPGVKPVDPLATPAPTDPPATTSTTGASGSAQPDPPAAPQPLFQTYLQDLAQSANIWIMAPGSWAPDVANPPPPNPSIISALKDLVSSAHGVVTQAIILRAGRGGPRGGTPENFASSDDAWADRVRNAINGLPPDQRPDALDQLNQEIDFRKKIRNLPPDQRRQMFMQHMMERMLYADRSRLSPEKRAKGYARMIAMREAARAQK